MASNLACVGLAVEDEEALGSLLRAVVPRAVPLGRVQGMEVLRWEDASGARLIVGLRDGEVVDFLPSFSGAPGARLAGVRGVTDSVATATVVDESGEQTTALALGAVHSGGPELDGA